MIQIKRGKTSNWRATTTAQAAGQPGYDKDKHKIKVGDGETLWKDLPYASGLFDYEILNSEVNAKNRYDKDNEDSTIITYGTEIPNTDTVGRLYLQQYDTAPETDYIVEYGINGIWTYQRWYSGFVRCSGRLLIETSLKDSFDGVSLYVNKKAIGATDYPFTFKEIPTETATIQSKGHLVWLANEKSNTKTASGKYRIVSPAKSNETSFVLNIDVQGTAT